MLSYGFWNWWPLYTRSSRTRSPDDDDLSGLETRSPIDNSEMLTHRISFGPERVYAKAWLPDGSLLIKTVDTADLQHLGVSRFQPTPRPVPADPVEEENWAAKMRQIAPSWYRSIHGLYSFDRICLTPREVEKIFMGWPSKGGLWELRYPDGRVPNELGHLSVCINMDERREVPKSFGAQYFDNPNDCFELSQANIDDCRQQRDKGDLGRNL